MLVQYADSQMYEELKALSKFHNLSLYGVIDDAVTFSDQVDKEKINIGESLRAGSIRNFFNPIIALKYLFIFLSTKFKLWRFK